MATMNTALHVLLGFSAILTRANAQSATPCPRENSVTGYTSIEELNSDMLNELQKIQEGSTPANEYTFRLCPDTVFDTTTTPLRPVLDNALFICGETGVRTNSCTFIGGSEQIRFEDSAVEGYALKEMSFMGLSFADFEGNAELTGTSIGAYASSQLTATFTSVGFTDFASDFVVRQTAGFSADPPMTIEMRDVTITGGTSGVIIDNDGGVFTLTEASVTDVTSAALIATANSGNSFLQDSSVSKSSLNSVTYTTAAGTTSVMNTKVTQMVSVDDVFYIEGAGSSLSLSETEVSGTKVGAPLSWTAISVQSQATATIDKMKITDNQGLEFGLSATLAGVASIKDSVFENNQGVQSLNRTSASIFGISDSDVTVERSQFTGNEGFSAVGVFLLRSKISLSTSCIQDGSSEFVVSVDSTSDFSVDMNFLENYDSQECDIGARLFKETDGSGCFVGSGTCEGTCEVLADQTGCNISVEPTTSPTASAPVATTVSPTRRPVSELTQQPTVPPVAERTLMPSTLSPTSLPSLSPEPTFLESEEPSSIPSELLPTFEPSTEAIEPEEKSGKGKGSKKSSKKGKKSSKSGKGGKGSSKGKKSKSGKGYTEIPALAITMSPTGFPSDSPSTTLEQQRSIHEGLSRQIVGRRQWRKFLQDVAKPDEESS